MAASASVGRTLARPRAADGGEAMQDELRSFVRDALARGLPRAAVRERLREAGWRAEEIETALAAWVEVDFPVPVPRRLPRLSAREAFLYLVLFATLYISAFNTGLVLFAALDRWLPDLPLEPYGARRAVEVVRNGIAGLVIAFPIFFFVAGLIGRALVREPEKRGSEIRKWLTYLTLFFTALVLIGDLTFLVQRLLAGELPVRVLLKVLVVFAIAGTIFGHYLTELRRDEREGEPAPAAGGSPWLARVAALAVIGTVALGLFAAGSPGHARLQALDQRRVGELQLIETDLEEEYDSGRGLPGSLGELVARGTAKQVRSIRDPQSGVPYGYARIDSARYELCASFALADSMAGEGGGRGGFWNHPAGRKCYVLDYRARRVTLHPKPAPLAPVPAGGSGD
jgi:hypothetical protein